ncbi:dihydroorotase [Conexibacter woesei]|uniref:Amidohydrolase n=1 Tax=Conexibacter woesei (strain DSM 14684 / CCUG 47730 / CIP 108061 / JCM 11494 / NBRC 100937 / ID131577) TaxID=469383 RepID=D3F6W0_CONWI|nr:amidohydrolase family protein [Conexibacter woesei]ADB52758.1 amidohydrolase [Conexibacter woesei DSM 14684]
MTDPRAVDLVITGGTVVSPSGPRRAGIAIDGGRIVAIADDSLLPPARTTHDATGLHVIPGLVDTEAHPGCYVPLRQDLESESRAAVTAGVTTWGIHAPSTRMGHPDWVEFVNKEDVGSFHDSMPHFIDIVEEVSAVNVFATYMLETDQQAREIPEYAQEWGVTSIKLYLQAMSPEAEPHWPGRRAGLGAGFDDGVVYQVMENVAALGDPGIVAMHCENWEIARVFDERLRSQGRTDWATWSDRSPHFLEAQHLRQYGHFAEYLGCPIYVQHATTPETYAEILDLRGRGVTVHAQTGPHWLQFGKEEHNAWRINVPLRSRENNPNIWNALAADVVNAVGSDHVTPWGDAGYDDCFNENIWELKTGFTSRVEMLLPVLLEGVHQQKITLERLVEVACENPAKIFGLFPQKGAIEVGADADLVLVDLDRTVKVDNSQLLTRTGWSVLDGRTIHGWNVATFLGGKQMSRWEDGAPKPEFLGGSDGRYLRRTAGQARVPLELPVEAN